MYTYHIYALGNGMWISEYLGVENMPPVCLIKEQGDQSLTATYLSVNILGGTD